MATTRPISAAAIAIIAKVGASAANSLLSAALVPSTIRAGALFRSSGLQVTPLVARGFGIALVPRTLANARASANAFPKIGIAELKRPELRWELVVAYHGRSGMAQSRNPAVAAFTAVLSKVRDDGRLA